LISKILSAEEEEEEIWSFFLIMIKLILKVVTAQSFCQNE
jgi:hypothetical protein